MARYPLAFPAVMAVFPSSRVTLRAAADTQVANSALTRDGQFTDNELATYS